LHQLIRRTRRKLVRFSTELIDEFLPEAKDIPEPEEPKAKAPETAEEK
jgi:hypothetical protein